MTVSELLDKCSDGEIIEVSYTDRGSCQKLKLRIPPDILDREVKSVKTKNCAMIFIETE